MTCHVTCQYYEMISAIKAVILGTAVLLLGITNADANPDVWVKTGLTYQFDNGKLSGLQFTWQFDEYYSSRSIQTYDTNQNKILESDEVSRLRAEAFDPLARFGYYIHLWVGGEKHKQLTIKDFAATIDGTQLVYRFTAALIPPADPNTDAIVTSLYDDKIVVDFRFFKENFLLVEGDIDPGCKFRIARGKGAQSGHPQVVTLKCRA